MSEKLVNPLTHRKVLPSLKNAQLIASKLKEEDVPLIWRTVINKYKKEGHKIEFMKPDGTLDKLVNPLTKRKVSPSLKNAQEIASQLEEDDVPLVWRTVIKMYQKEGHVFVFKSKLPDKLIHPLTKKKVKPTLKNAKAIASELYKDDVPLGWRVVITAFQNQGHAIAYKRELPEGHILYKGKEYRPIVANKDLNVYITSDKYQRFFYIHGEQRKVQAYIDAIYRDYHPSGYGTHFEQIEQWKNGHVTFVGSHFFSAD